MGCAAALSAWPVCAQVKSDILRKDPYVPDWSGAVESSFALSRGNINIIDIGGSGQVQYQTLYDAPADEKKSPDYLPYIKQRYYLTANARFASNDGKTFISQDFAHLRWTSMWHPRVGSDAFVQHQFNKFLRLTTRLVGGTGPRFELLHLRELTVTFASAYMLEFEEINVEMGAADRESTLNHRWSNHVTVRTSVFDDQLLVQNTLFYQPLFTNFADYRILNELEFVATISERFGCGLTVSILHDSRPPSDVLKTDARLLNTLRITL